MILLLLLPLLLNAQDAVTIRYSRQSKAVLDTVSGGSQMKGTSIWQANACNWTGSDYRLSLDAVTYAAASKIAVTDYTLTQAVIDHARKNTRQYRFTDTASKLVNIGAMIVPTLQAADVIKGSPWISGGVAATAIVMQVLIKQKDELLLNQLPGHWEKDLNLRPRECGTFLFLGQYTPQLATFQVDLPLPTTSRGASVFETPSWQTNRQAPSFE